MANEGEPSPFRAWAEKASVHLRDPDGERLLGIEEVADPPVREFSQEFLRPEENMITALYQRNEKGLSREERRRLRSTMVDQALSLADSPDPLRQYRDALQNAYARVEPSRRDRRRLLSGLSEQTGRSQSEIKEALRRDQ